MSSTTARTAAARRKHLEAMTVKGAMEEALLSAVECGAACGGISAQNWPRYAARWPNLRAGMRIVRVGGKRSRGRARWLKSAVVEHIRSELLRPDRDRPHEEHDVAAAPVGAGGPTKRTSNNGTVLRQ